MQPGAYETGYAVEQGSGGGSGGGGGSSTTAPRYDVISEDSVARALAARAADRRTPGHAQGPGFDPAPDAGEPRHDHVSEASIARALVARNEQGQPGPGQGSGPVRLRAAARGGAAPAYATPDNGDGVDCSVAQGVATSGSPAVDYNTGQGGPPSSSAPTEYRALDRATNTHLYATQLPSQGGRSGTE